jgi:hypothetical protein
MMVYSTQNHWVSGLGPSSIIINNQKNFGNWKFFRVQVKGRKHSVGSLRKTQPTSPIIKSEVVTATNRGGPYSWGTEVLRLPLSISVVFDLSCSRISTSLKFGTLQSCWYIIQVIGSLYHLHRKCKIWGFQGGDYKVCRISSQRVGR